MKKHVLVWSLMGLVWGDLAFALDQQTELRLQRLERRVGHITELMLEVQALKRSNSELQGQVEELQHALERLQRKQQTLYLDLDERIEHLRQGGGASAQTPPSHPPTTEGSANTSFEPNAQSIATGSAVALDPAAVKADYERAYALLQPSQRRYSEAITAFKAFLQKYPPNDYSDNAWYWLGEAYYAAQDNEQALKAFKQLLAEYPQSPKVPGALLKIGYILDAQGQRAQAQKTLNRILQEYPDSSVASVARARLRHMQKSPR